MNNTEKTTDLTEDNVIPEETGSGFRIDNAEEKLKAVCEKALLEKYGENIPELIRERYESELKNILDNGFTSYYVLAYMLAEKIKELGYLYNIRGCACGSFISYLMGITETNPLTPHYYCPKCKRVEFVNADKWPSGFDLVGCNLDPEFCPDCGERLEGDGHNIPVEFFAGYRGDRMPRFDFNVAPEIHQTLVDFLGEILGSDRTYVEGPVAWISYEKAGLTADDYHTYGIEHFNIIQNKMFSELKLLEDRTGIAAKSIKFSDIDIFSFYYDDSFEGLPFDAEMTRETADVVFPIRFSDLVKMFGLEHGTGVWEGNGKLIVGFQCDPSELIAYREDVMLNLMKHGVERSEAYEIAEMVRKGKTSRFLSPEKEKMLKDHGVPDWYIESMKKIEYLFPKSHGTEYVMNYLRLVWYKINYPAEFKEIVCAGKEINKNGHIEA